GGHRSGGGSRHRRAWGERSRQAPSQLFGSPVTNAQLMGVRDRKSVMEGGGHGRLRPLIDASRISIGWYTRKSPSLCAVIWRAQPGFPATTALAPVASRLATLRRPSSP